jgi:hypothetical protein
MSARSDALDFAKGIADSVVETIVDAAERERARRRCEACVDVVFHNRMVALLPRWRFLARAHHRRRSRLAQARCDALRAKGDLVAIAICAGGRTA